MRFKTPDEALRYHASGAIERGEKEAIVEQRANADCPRCGKPCPVLPHDSAHCTQCMAGFRVTP